MYYWNPSRIVALAASLFTEKGTAVNALYQLIPIAVGGLLVLIVVLKSFHNIGPSEVGLVSKAIGKKLPEGSLIAENGEAGYQRDMLLPGLRFKLWPFFKVTRHPWVQIPPGAIGVVIAQVGAPLPVGAKSAMHNEAIGTDFGDLGKFLTNGGQRGVQRPVLPPGTIVPMHPVAFVVATRDGVFGQVLSEGTTRMIQELTREQLSVVNIAAEGNGDHDVIGVVTTLEGPPLPSGDIAGRIGGFEDVEAAEASSTQPGDIIQMMLGNKNVLHNNYQDFQAFLDAGGCIGLQHDPLLFGSYNLNPFLVSVERVPMLVVNQGEVAVVKSYVGLPTVDTSGEDYRFGSIVAPGHRGIWAEPLRTGKYALNPHIYKADVVPTSILTLNWATATSQAHDLDSRLSPIDAKSKDAFDFLIDLQVQIHVPDTRAPKVIGMVGTMQNLVNEVLQSAVGNYFRNKLQELPAASFMQERSEVQAEAQVYVTDYLRGYDVEVRGVYIQAVVNPPELVEVLTSREIAAQEKTTYAAQQDAQQARIALEAQRGEADMQAQLAQARVSVDINKANAQAAVAAAEGQATVTKTIGEADGAKITAIGAAEASAIEAKGLAEAAAYEAQKQAIGSDQTAAVAIVKALGDGGITKLVPDTVVGDSNGGSLAGLLTLALTNAVKQGGNQPSEEAAPAAQPE